MATGIPRPHQWLLMGIQRRQYSYPKARSIASSGRSSVPFARHSQPTGIPRPHQWLLMGVQAFSGRSSVPFASVRSQPASQGHINGILWALMASKLAVCQPLNPKTLQTLKTLQTPKTLLMGVQRRQPTDIPRHINGFLWAWAVQRAVRPEKAWTPIRSH